MSKHRTDLTRGLPLPSTWVNAFMEFVSTMQGNLKLERVDDTTIRIPAGATNDQVALAIAGKWRWIAANITAAIPAGAAQTYDVWAAANANDLTAVDPADATNYAFTISVRARVSGSPDPPPAAGATAISRKIGEVVWSGTKMTRLSQTVGPAALKLDLPFGAAGLIPVVDALGVVTWTPRGGSVPIGAMIPYAGTGDPGVLPEGGEYKLADGRLVSTTTYPALLTAMGHAYNGGVDPGGGNVRLPDKRGRGSIGQDNMGTAQGAAGRIAIAAAARGQNGGAERVTLASAESGQVAHAHSDTFGVASAVVAPAAHVLAYAGGVTTISSTLGGPGLGVVAANSTADGWQGTSGSHVHAVTGSIAASSAAAAAQSHNNLGPYECDNWIVRVA